MSALINWKTTVMGLAVLVCGVVLPQFGIQVPGFSMDLGAALATAFGLIFAKDANK
jgi:hypothetical protein